MTEMEQAIIILGAQREIDVDAFIGLALWVCIVAAIVVSLARGGLRRLSTQRRQNSSESRLAPPPPAPDLRTSAGAPQVTAGDSAGCGERLAMATA